MVCTVVVKSVEKLGFVCLSTKVNGPFLSVKWLSLLISISFLTLIFCRTRGGKELARILWLLGNFVT